MTNLDILEAVPARSGHFLLESGYHTDLWLTLEALFISPRRLAPLVSMLAARLEPHAPSAVCGPLLGGAFLAQTVATTLEIDFYFTEPVNAKAPGLFGAEYRLQEDLQRRIRDKRVAIVDDVISAGSSARATAAAVAAAGGSTVVVGTLLVLGTLALDHFARAGVPVEALERKDFALWAPSACPLCSSGVPLEDLVHGTRPAAADDAARL